MFTNENTGLITKIDSRKHKLVSTPYLKKWRNFTILAGMVKGEF